MRSTRYYPYRFRRWNGSGRQGRTAPAAVAAVLAVVIVAMAPASAPGGAEASKWDSPPADTLHLEQVVEDVLRRNEDVSAARYMEQSSLARVGPAGAWDDPMLMLGVTNLPTSFDFQTGEMTMKMVGVSQRIPYAGERGLQSKSARSEAAAAVERRRAVELRMVTAARFAYFDLYYQTQTLEDLKRQEELMRQVAASASAKLRVSQAGQDEVLAAQADVWRLQSTLLSAEADVLAAGSTLNSLRGLDPRLGVPPLAAPHIADVPPQPDGWLLAVSEHYPRLKELESLSESYGFSAAAADRMRLPMLDLSASYGLREDGPMGPRDDMVSFQATLSLPVFAGRRQGQTARAMRAMQSSTDAEAAQLRREVTATLLTLHERAQRLSKSLELYREQIVPAAEDAYRSALAGYINNRTSFIALLTYAGAVYRDRITANQLGNELARTLAEVETYTADPAAWAE